MSYIRFSSSNFRSNLYIYVTEYNGEPAIMLYTAYWRRLFLLPEKFLILIWNFWIKRKNDSFLKRILGKLYLKYCKIDCFLSFKVKMPYKYRQLCKVYMFSSDEDTDKFIEFLFELNEHNLLNTKHLCMILREFLMDHYFYTSL